MEDLLSTVSPVLLVVELRRVEVHVEVLALPPSVANVLVTWAYLRASPWLADIIHRRAENSIRGGCNLLFGSASIFDRMHRLDELSAI